ncbi:MAG: glutamate--tRNA ligase [Candidatus Thermoplasmatota archaeon]|nr:glutamate--tRNA ligase [Candidatus Thermoplasmatota archaeon]
MTELIRKYALQNAILHKGKAELQAVVSKIVAEKPDLKQKIKELIPEIKKVVLEVNSIPLEKQKQALEKLAPELLIKERRELEKKLPELPNVGKKVILRFAPGPSGPLHLGHSRAAILNDEYAKMYGGKLINRIEDTDPDRIDPSAYELIKEDLDWLEIKAHDTVIQSDRFEIYYEYAKKLLEQNNAYVCKCNAKDWRALKLQSKACEHRNLPIEKNLEEFDKMLSNFYKQEEASVIVKTDLSDPNPALRDFVALRICQTPHPKTGNKYIVYPLMNFAVAIDDYLLGLTHVLRGKDHINNTYRQARIFDYFKWRKPQYIHYGRVSIEQAVLKTSKIKEGIKSGVYESWSDPRLATLSALRKRGIHPRAIRNLWIATGIKEVDIQLAWENLYTLNKEIIDKSANRYFFVWKPKLLEITGIDRLEGHAPLHPDFKERGTRKVVLEKPIKVFVSEDDLKALKINDKIRLKDLCNIELTARTKAKYIGQDLAILKEGAKIIHWVNANENIKTKVIFPNATIAEGFAEEHVKKELGNIVQFERFGFVKVNKLNEFLICYFAHR